MRQLSMGYEFNKDQDIPEINQEAWAVVAGLGQGVRITFGTVRETIMREFFEDTKLFDEVLKGVKLRSPQADNKTDTWKSDLILKESNRVYIIDSKTSYDDVNHNISIENDARKYASAYDAYKEDNPNKEVRFIFASAKPISKRAEEHIKCYAKYGMEIIQTDELIKELTGEEFDIESKRKEGEKQLIEDKLRLWCSGKHSKGSKMPEDFINAYLNLITMEV